MGRTPRPRPVVWAAHPTPFPLPVCSHRVVVPIHLTYWWAGVVCGVGDLIPRCHCCARDSAITPPPLPHTHTTPRPTPPTPPPLLEATNTTMAPPAFLLASRQGITYSLWVFVGANLGRWPITTCYSYTGGVNHLRVYRMYSTVLGKLYGVGWACSWWWVNCGWNAILSPDASDYFVADVGDR